MGNLEADSVTDMKTEMFVCLFLSSPLARMDDWMSRDGLEAINIYRAHPNPEKAFSFYAADSDAISLRLCRPISFWFCCTVKAKARDSPEAIHLSTDYLELAFKPSVFIYCEDCIIHRLRLRCRL